MKIDTSSYYPKSLLEDDSEDEGITIGNDKELIPSETPKENKRQDEKEESDPDLPPTEMEHLADRLSTFLSWIMVPLLMPVYGIILAFNCSILDFTPLRTKLVFTAIAVGINVALPVLLMMLLKRVGLISDMGLNGRKERLIPYVITVLCMGVTGFFMGMRGAPVWLEMFFYGGAVAAFVNMGVNFCWKISAHAAGIAGVVALMVRIISVGYPQKSAFLWLIISILLAGFLGSSRLWLGRHTVWQVLAGYAVGFLSVLLLTL